MAEEKTNTLPVDGDRHPIQVAYSIATQDATGTPQVSPLTTVTTVKTFVPPANALVFWLRSTAAGRVGDNVTLDGSGSGKGYVLLPADEWKAFPCADGESLYFLPDSSATVYFYFEVLE